MLIGAMEQFDAQLLGIRVNGRAEVAGIGLCGGVGVFEELPQYVVSREAQHIVLQHQHVLMADTGGAAPAAPWFGSPAARAAKPA